MTIECGVVLPGGSATQQLELAVLAERSGWDGVFVWEAAYGVDAWSLLSAMAVRTERVRLGTLLTPLPWRRPWKVASQLVTLDELSGGRAILSVGLGAIDPELGSTGEPTDRKHRAELLDDGLGIIDALASGTRTYAGVHYTIDLDRAMYAAARPVRRPRPTVWIVGLWGSERSMGRVLRGDGYLPNLRGGPGRPTPDQVAEMRTWLDQHATDGRVLDLVVDGTTPADDQAGAAAIVTPYADAGATWWIDADWTVDMNTTDGVDRIRARLTAGPPRPR